MHESLNKKILQKINPKKLKAELIEAYKEYSVKTRDRFMLYREGEESVILEFLNTLYGLSIKYEQDFLDYKNNPKKLHVTLGIDNRSWVQFIYDIQLRQPAKLIALKYLNFMGLYVPVEINEEGWHQYKFHLINRLLQLNELYNLADAGKIDEQTRSGIYSIIVDDVAKIQLSKEINKFNEHHNVPYKVDIDRELEKEKLASKPVVKPSNSSLQDKMKNVDKFFSERKPTAQPKKPLQ
jgi:hypothetical protein